MAKKSILFEALLLSVCSVFQVEAFIDEIVGKEGESVILYCNASRDTVKMGQVLTFKYQTRRLLGSCILGQNKCALDALYEGQYRLSVSNDVFQLVIVSLSESVIGTYTCVDENDKLLNEVDVKLKCVEDIQVYLPSEAHMIQFNDVLECKLNLASTYTPSVQWIYPYKDLHDTELDTSRISVYFIGEYTCKVIFSNFLCSGIKSTVYIEHLNGFDGLYVMLLLLIIPSGLGILIYLVLLWKDIFDREQFTVIVAQDQS